jgi:hypothetical protein
MRDAVLSKPWAAEPDHLRQAVQEAVSLLSEEQRGGYCRRLLAALAEQGLNVPALLFVSGVVKQESADLTPPEIAHLFRYVRINAPWALVEKDKILDGLVHKREARTAA